MGVALARASLCLLFLSSSFFSLSVLPCLVIFVLCTERAPCAAVSVLKCGCGIGGGVREILTRAGGGRVRYRGDGGFLVKERREEGTRLAFCEEKVKRRLFFFWPCRCGNKSVRAG